MIHIIYIYLIISAIVLGALIGELADYNGAIVIDIFRSLLWPYFSIKWLLVILWTSDIMQFTLVHIGINVLKRNTKALDIIAKIEIRMAPHWLKWWYGGYLRSGLKKLKKMNTAL